MNDNSESIALRVTVIGGQRYDDDYHRGLARHGHWPAKTPTGRHIGIECANEDHGPAIRFHVDRMRGRSADGPDKMRRSLGGLIESVCNTQSSLSRNGNGSK